METEAEAKEVEICIHNVDIIMKRILKGAEPGSH